MELVTQLRHLVWYVPMSMKYYVIVGTEVWGGVMFYTNLVSWTPMLGGVYLA